MSAPSKDALSAYPAGHHAAVVRSHTSRTAENSAPHLLPYIKPGMRVLDIGCGPGTITNSFARLIGDDGQAVGVDPSESVVQQAKEIASSQNIKNVQYQVGNAMEKLPFPDSSFNIVHAHQVLQHVSDPVAMLKEMKRLAKSPGGIVSLRESDFKSIIIYPDIPALQDEWVDLYVRAATDAGGQPRAGRRLHVWAKEAGFKPEEVVKVQAGTFCYGQASPEERAWWGGLWAERVGTYPESGFAKTVVDKGFGTKEQITAISEAWKRWSKHEDAYFAMIHGEVILRQA